MALIPSLSPLIRPPRYRNCRGCGGDDNGAEEGRMKSQDPRWIQVSSFKFITTPTRHDACIGHVITSRKRNFPGTCNNINTSNLVPAGDSTPLSPIARSRPERTQRICVMSCRREQIDRCTDVLVRAVHSTSICTMNRTGQCNGT